MGGRRDAEQRGMQPLGAVCISEGFGHGNMKTQSTRYVVQYKSVYEEVSTSWQDTDGRFLTIQEAKYHADGLRVANPNVRIVCRQITETVV